MVEDLPRLDELGAGALLHVALEYVILEDERRSRITTEIIMF
jgi:hypothetical protein